MKMIVGRKGAKSSIWIKVISKSVKLNVDVSGELTDVNTVEKKNTHIVYFYSYTAWLTIYLMITRMMNVLQLTLRNYSFYSGNKPKMPFL